MQLQPREKKKISKPLLNLFLSSSFCLLFFFLVTSLSFPSTLIDATSSRVEEIFIWKLVPLWLRLFFFFLFHSFFFFSPLSLTLSSSWALSLSLSFSPLVVESWVPSQLLNLRRPFPHGSVNGSFIPCPFHLSPCSLAWQLKRSGCATQWFDWFLWGRLFPGSSFARQVDQKVSWFFCCLSKSEVFDWINPPSWDNLLKGAWKTWEKSLGLGCCINEVTEPWSLQLKNHQECSGWGRGFFYSP